MEIDAENVNYLIGRIKDLELQVKLKDNAKEAFYNIESRLEDENCRLKERIKELEETADAVSKSVVLETKVRHDVEHEVIELRNVNKLSRERMLELENNLSEAERKIEELEEAVAKYDFLE